MADRINLSEGHRTLIGRYYNFYFDLDTGRRAPETPLQEHFVSVCRGLKPPLTEHEYAYFAFKLLLVKTRLTPKELIARELQVPGLCERKAPVRFQRTQRTIPSRVDAPSPQERRLEHHMVRPDRWSTRRREVPRHNW